MAETASAQEITITRVDDAPRELVWRAWTEPDRLARWWGPDGWSTPLARLTMDVRPRRRLPRDLGLRRGRHRDVH